MTGTDEASLVLLDLAAGVGPSELKKRTPDPVRIAIDYRVDGRGYQADLYRPEEPPGAAILLVPGVAQQGRNDPRLVAFATTLARARFVVLVPDLSGLRSLRVSATDVQGVVDAFSHLRSRAEIPADGRLGIGAFSYSVGPAVLAALTPVIEPQVDFVLGVGGYYDLKQVLLFFTTGYFREQEDWRYLAPNHYAKWVFVLGNAYRLATPNDRQLLTLMARRKMSNPAAPAADLIAQLSADGSTVYAFVTNSDPTEAPLLAERLPAAIRNDLEALTLANKDLSRLTARLILVHGLDDNIIPYTQSVALAAAVPKGQARLFLVAGLAHVDLQPGLLDHRTAWRAVRSLLDERDRRRGQH
jgi:pimeloyl-ACP methyl ester carboxylesterase